MGHLFQGNTFQPSIGCHSSTYLVHGMSMLHPRSIFCERRVLRSWLKSIPGVSMFSIASLRSMVRATLSRRPAGVVKAGITKAYPYACIGCNRTFKQKKHLARHYGKTGLVRRKYNAGTLVAADLQRHKQCKYALTQKAHGDTTPA